MQDNIELENILRQAYNGIIIEGKSLRKVSEETGIERKRLKQLMAEILSPDELARFNKALDKRNNRKRAVESSNKHKKAKALENDMYKEAIEELAESGVRPEWIEEIYTRCKERAQTRISRDTLAIKLVELLNYFQTRNEGLSEESKGFISSQDVVEMILKNPRIITSDVKNNIIPKCSVITGKNDNDINIANIKIKRNPGIFRKTIRDIREGK